MIEKLNIGYEVLRERNPSIIYARIKGFGLSGPYADFKCFDSVALAAGGVYSINGEPGGPPMRPGASFGDTGTGPADGARHRLRLRAAAGAPARAS